MQHNSALFLGIITLRIIVQSPISAIIQPSFRQLLLQNVEIQVATGTSTSIREAQSSRIFTATTLAYLGPRKPVMIQTDTSKETLGSA